MEEEEKNNEDEEEGGVISFLDFGRGESDDEELTEVGHEEDTKK